MILIFIILTAILDLFGVYGVVLLLWRLGYNKRAFLSLNIVGVFSLTVGLLFLPYSNLFGYLTGIGVFNFLWSLWFLNWKELPYNLHRMYWNDHLSEQGFINQVRLEKPASIYHYAFSADAPYAYIQSIENDTLTIQRLRDNQKVQVNIKDFYKELANYKLSRVGGIIK